MQERLTVVASAAAPEPSSVDRVASGPPACNDEFALHFTAEESDGDAPQPRPLVWHILVVDDDPDVFRATRFALAGVTLFGRQLALHQAASAAQARQMLAEGGPAVALVLLDVVMETPSAGLELVQHIRGELGLHATRIVLRTGQPGYAPEQDTILRYDINDYRTKDELSHQRLLTAVATALRSYQQICAIEANRQGLQRIVQASAAFMSADNLGSFADGVIPQVAALLELSGDGLVCVRPDKAGMRQPVLAATGAYAAYVHQDLSLLPDPALRAVLQQAFEQRRCIESERGFALHVGARNGSDLALFLDSRVALSSEQRQLLDVFRVHLEACLRNLGLLERLHRQAYLDPLLGLPNRTRFIEHIDAALQPGAAPAVLALVDIDDFAAVNDLMGHAYGDAVLRATANRLVAHFGAEVVLARMNSNTFGLLGPASRVSPSAVQSALHEPVSVGERPHNVSMTGGFADLEPGVQPGADWLKDVGIALKHAKTHLRGRHAVFTPSMGQEARSRAQLLASLHQAFAETRLYVVYQPQLDLASGQVVGLEALLRWRADDGRMVPPDDFIPVAEQSGLILPLGDWVLQVACATMRDLLDRGIAPLRMAVNVSVVQFQQSDFAQRIADALREHRLPGAALELELTESVAVLGLETVASGMAALRALGVSIAIDDFGTGYSSLSYLGALPVDRLKIDRSFVLQIEHQKGPRIAELITQLGSKLGLRVLAEGIETEAARDKLLAMGCHEGQGYLFAQPLELADLLAWLPQGR